MMKKNKKSLLQVLAILASLPILALAFFIFIVGPVDTSRENSVQYAGVVEQIQEGTSHDIVFKLKDQPNTFYINRGLERGLNLEALEEELLGKEVALWYAKSWPIESGHMTRLAYNGAVLFSEW